MKRLYLGLVIHNHQPVGNFPWVLEQAFRQTYLPFLEALERHPGLRLSLHYSGPLWDWLKENRPDFPTRLARLVKRGQVEMVGGGYYEPIIPLIPDADKAGQIALMRRVLARDLGAEATGLWLAERVWEPHLPKPLAQAGVEWTVVDDTHFKMVGFEEQDLLGYYLTEEQGYYLKVYATSQKLRYLIPWKRVEEVLDYLRSLASEDGGRIAVMGDDGEKFGTWPGTFEHCWEKGWMESFFTALEESREWLETIPLGEYARRFPALGPAYLPDASYAEMMEWALPAEKSSQFVGLRQEMERAGRQDILSYLRGGFWRHFLVKYPEVNRLYKKMLRVHRKVHRAAALSPEEVGLHELWKGQCNCAYWHGVFGGVYLSDIRAADYRHLLKAESWADALLRPSAEGLCWGNGGQVEVEKEDFDGDGREELLVEGEKQNLYVHLARGGSLFEWDLRPQAHNLLSTVTRRPEAYHFLLEAKPGGEAKEGAAPESTEGEVETIHAGI
ncbi:MAG: DUF1925 domain-containing protein, partial [Chloroflexota bacterium]|nr:DUF1925 domain-containing protein [Chloroflexota bacterium]